MKRKLGSLIALVFFALTGAYAQDPVFLNGDRVVNAGIGFGTTFYSGTYYSTQIPPVSISYEQGIIDEVLEKGVIGVGAYAGFSSYKYEISGWGLKYSNIMIGARGAFHYPLIDDLDTYTGLILGYRILSSSEFGNSIPGWDYNVSSGGIFGSWFVGARYFFNEQFGVMAELGTGIAYLNIGISVKL